MIRLLFAAADGREREALREAALGQRRVSLIGTARDGQEAVQLAVQYRPDVAILTDDLPVLDAYQAVGLIGAACPGVKPVLVVGGEEPPPLHRAMRLGARECLPRPAPPARLLQVALQLQELDRVREQPEYRTALDPARFPRLIAVTGAKGGIGKTSTAANLAVALARAGRGETCLVDLYTQFGDIGTVLNVRPPRALVDLARLKEEVDLDGLEAATVTHASGLRVILGSSSPQPLDALSLERLEQIFRALRQRYRFIVVDVPNVLHAATIRVLESAHLVLLICNLMDLTTVADTRRWLESVQEASLPRERLRLVLNRVGRENPLAETQVEESVRLRAWARLPNEPELVSRCANRGVPYVLEAPHRPVSRAVTELARLLTEETNGVEPAPPAAPAVPPKPKRGPFGLLLRRGAA